MFTSPPEATLEWNDAGVEGSYRFLRRVWNFGVKLNAMDSGADSVDGMRAAGTFDKETKALRRDIHTVLKQVDYDYQRMQYNTVVSGTMKLLNALEDFKSVSSVGAVAALREGFSILLRCLYPATPHIATRLWQDMGYAGRMGDLLAANWPGEANTAMRQDEVECVLQITAIMRRHQRGRADAARAQVHRRVGGNSGARKVDVYGVAKQVV